MRNPVIFLITDTHIGGDFCRDGVDHRPKDFAQRILKNCRKVIAPQDILIHLGDVIDRNQSDLGEWLGQIKCATKVCCRGNHDRQSDTWFINKGFNLVCEQIVFGDVLLAHKPLPLPKGIRLQIFGHFHDNPLDRCFQFEPELREIYCSETHRLLAMEHTDYCPVRLDEFAK